jgi:pimeloyl-ACP methyl ester carboxylesterase
MNDVRFIEANGLKFAYLSWGNEGAPLVLLFHGFPDTARTWDVIGPRVAAAGFRVVAPFMRGYAPSAIPQGDTDSTTLGRDVCALVEAFGVEKARIVGHDWGAEAVMAAVGLAPQRIERMVHIGIPHRATLRPTLKQVWHVRHFVSLRLPGAAARCARDDFATLSELCRRWSPTWKFTDDDLRSVKESFSVPGSLHAALGYYRALTPTLPECMRARVTVPSLAVAGSDDPGVTVAAFEDARRHFAARYEVAAIPGGHFCHRESPEPLLAAIIPFLQ